jgi:hypothetical protein
LNPKSLSFPVLGAFAFAGSLTLAGSDAFTPYLGAISPPLAILVVTLTGWAALRWLDRLDVFGVSGVGWRRRLGEIVLAALVFGGIVVSFDAAYDLDARIVPLPDGAVFYPIIGFVVEIVFHVLVAAALLAVSAMLRIPVAQSLWPCLIATACVEPAFQIWSAIADPASAGWRHAFVFAHVLAFNLAQVAIWRRHGFGWMLGVRWLYYAVWHIAWPAIQ